MDFSRVFPIRQWLPKGYNYTQMFNIIRDYEKSFTFETELAGTTLQVVSKPGFPSWDKISPAQGLIAELIDCSQNQELLMLNVGHGAAAAILAGKLPNNSTIHLMDLHFNALQCAEKNLIVNRKQNFSIIKSTGIPSKLKECIDAVVVEIPKGRNLTRRWIIEAYEALKPSGTLYIGGANNQGIHSAIKDTTELLGKPLILGYRKGCRLAKFIKPETSINFPLWSQEAGVAPGSWITFNHNTTGVSITYHSLPGVFSADAVDEGTQLLLENYPSCKGKMILDVGCGYGILGIAAALHAQEEGGEAYIDLLDNNFLAVACAEKNIKFNAIPNVNVFPSDLLSAKSNQKYQLIFSNPPFHAGTEIDYSITLALIRQASQALEPGGQLFIVSNHFLRYEQIMRPLFTSVEIRARNKKFHVIVGNK